MLDPLMLARTAHFAAAAMLSGLTFFLLLIAEPVWTRAFDRPDPGATGLRRQLVRFGWAMLALSIASGFAWLVLLASRLSDQSFEAALRSRATWKVLTETQFGYDWQGRGALAASIAACLARIRPASGWRSRFEGVIAVVLSGGFMASLAWAGHGGAGSGTAGLIQLGGDALHLVAAGAWIGALVPFALLMACALRIRSKIWNAIAADVTARFSTFGVVVVTVLLLTGVCNTWFLVGSLTRLVGTAYGQLLLLKLALVTAMVAVAAVNRLVLMPRLPGTSQATRVLGMLRRNGVIEIALGLAILAIVGTLGTLPPAEHTQVQWPFPWRLSAEALSDPTRRATALIALAAVTAGAGAILGGVLLRRPRWPMVVTGALLLLVGAPRVGVFAVRAYPTSFYASPTGYSVESIAAGEAAFADNCAVCHGPEGHGDGPEAKSLQPPPADLTAAHVYAHSDGDLFWWITHGIGNAMPAFGSQLDATARWNLIDFIHANADATRFSEAADAGMANAFRTPDFAIDCPDGSSPAISDLHGRVLHVVFAGAGTGARLQHLESAAIVVRLDRSIVPDGRFCSSDDPDVAKVFALYLGSAVEQLDGAELLIDAEGSLRSAWHPGLVPDWTDPTVFADVVAQITRTPSRPYSAASAHGH